MSLDREQLRACHEILVRETGTSLTFADFEQGLAAQYGGIGFKGSVELYGELERQHLSFRLPVAAPPRVDSLWYVAHREGVFGLQRANREFHELWREWTRPPFRPEPRRRLSALAG
jgi:hypothetical protein